MSSRAFKTNFRKFMRKFRLGLRFNESNLLEVYRLTDLQIRNYYGRIEQVKDAPNFHKLGVLNIHLLHGVTEVWSTKE